MNMAACASRLCLNNLRWRFNLLHYCSQACHLVTGASLYSTDTKHQQSKSSVLKTACVAAVGLLCLTTGTIIIKWTTRTQRFSESNAESFRVPFVDGQHKLLRLRNFSIWLPQQMFPNVSSVEKISQFQLHDDDILVVSFPKSGTTWLQQIILLILSVDAEGGQSDKDNMNIESLFPYLEYPYPGLAELAKRPGRRLLKSHLSYDMLPEGVRAGKGKVIYIARNPKDVCVSYYHFHRMLSMVKYHGSFKEFFEMFAAGTVAYGPWDEHVLGFWQRRSQRNVMYITYEQLHKRPVDCVHQIAGFLGKSLSDSQAKKVVVSSRFEAMRENPLVNYSWWDEYGVRLKEEAEFLRKGKVGDWQNYFTEEMELVMDKCCIQPLEQHGLSFDFSS